MEQGPIRIGMAGMGGYAACMTDRLLAHAGRPQPQAVLAAVCDPQLERFLPRVAELQSRGVRTVADFDQILADDSIDAVCLPIPIQFHLPYTQAALRSGKAVLCEKPAAGCIDDLDEMIASRDAAGLPVLIGFQDVYQPAVHELKNRLLHGDFGQVLEASVFGAWPRGRRYYERNDWAGALRRDGRWVLDSPANNAMAHFIHLLLFLLGPRQEESAVPIEVEAELYRANPIENYDTASLRLTLPGGVPVVVGMTHACATNIEPIVLIRARGATISYLTGDRIEITTDSVTERVPLSRNPHHAMFSALRQCMHSGEAGVRGGTLEMARSHTLAMSAASEAAPVAEIPEPFVHATLDDHRMPLRVVSGIETALRGAVEQGLLLHESRQAPWSHPASAISTAGYSHFSGPAGAEPTLEPQAV